MEDTIEVIDISVNKNDKFKKFLTHYIQETWDTMKRPNASYKKDLMLK